MGYNSVHRVLRMEMCMYLVKQLFLCSIEQWMNYLRQGFSEAEALWPQTRKIREVAPMFEFLNQATTVGQR